MLSCGVGSSRLHYCATIAHLPHLHTYYYDKIGFNVGQGCFEYMILYPGTCFSAAVVIVVDGEDEGVGAKRC